MTALVQLEDVFRVYPSPEGGVAALQGLTLAVEEGELCVVLGPSGSGKSTLLRIVAGFDRASAGSVRIAGVDVGSLSGWGAARFRSRSIGYADQHYWRALAGELTARELVGIQLGLAGIDKEQRDTRADELLERVGLGDRRDAHPRELSGGEQQRIALCAALASRPVLLIADEPTGELDAVTARDVLTLIAELVHESGGTALVVSHDPASAERADRVIHVRDGRISDERIAGAAGDGAIVVGRGGWLRLPEDLLRTAGIDRHATAELRGGAVVLEPTGPSVSETQASPVPHKQAVPEPPKGASVSETQSPSSFITVRALTKRFGTATPFERLDAAFAPGKLTVVTGPSGSGKTTLLRLLAGLELPDEGDVLLRRGLARRTRPGRTGGAAADEARVRRPDRRPDTLPRRAREHRARSRASRASDRQGGSGARSSRARRARRPSCCRALGRPARTSSARAGGRSRATRDRRG